ncbi:hypothetical protein BKA70DRAFT_1221407 [Coprinopsis sp. MPI-PUGE-AT-0042]|nr:hypothetical protein BKA70DRAFT_1221407 [Coprinopsis sp. MPI-PUGE-AT-0042]
MPKGRTKPKKKPSDTSTEAQSSKATTTSRKRSTLQSHLKTKKTTASEVTRNNQGARSRKCLIRGTKTRLTKTTDDEDNQQPNVPPPRVTRSQAAKVTINVDELSDTHEQDENDGAHTQGDEGSMKMSTEDDGDQDLRTPQPSSDGTERLDPVSKAMFGLNASNVLQPSIRHIIPQEVLSVEVPRLTPSQRAMYTPMASSIPGTPSASDQLEFRDGSALVCVGTIVYESHGSPSQEADSCNFRSFNAPRVKVPTASKSKELLQPEAHDTHFQEQPQSPTDSIRFNDLEWGDEDKDWAPASGNLTLSKTLHSITHPQEGRSTSHSFLALTRKSGFKLVSAAHLVGEGLNARSIDPTTTTTFRSSIRRPPPSIPCQTDSSRLNLGSFPLSPSCVAMLRRLCTDSKALSKNQDHPSNKRHEVCFQDCTGKRPLLSASSARLAAGLAAEQSQRSRGEPGLALRPSQPVTVAMPSSSFKSTTVREGQGQALCMDRKILLPRSRYGRTAHWRDIHAHGTTSARDSTSRGLSTHLGSLVKKTTKLLILSPPVRAHKKGKFSSGRLSKPHFLRAEKIRDSLLDLSLDSNHSVTHVLGSVGLIIGPERELNRWQAAEACIAMIPRPPKRKVHSQNMLDSKEAAVKNMEIVSQKATHLLASIVTSNTRIQEKIDAEEVWVESLRNMADAFNALDKSWIKWEDITLGELMAMSCHNGTRQRHSRDCQGIHLCKHNLDDCTNLPTQHSTATGAKPVNRDDINATAKKIPEICVLT